MSIATVPGLPQPRVSKVDCGTCQRCCKGNQLILLTEDDDPSLFDHYEVRPGMLAVKRAANGDCIYLGADGCTIWGKHPLLCRTFNCVDFVRRLDQGAFGGKGNWIDDGVVKEGRKRLASPKEA